MVFRLQDIGHAASPRGAEEVPRRKAQTRVPAYLPQDTTWKGLVFNKTEGPTDEDVRVEAVQRVPPDDLHMNRGGPLPDHVQSPCGFMREVQNAPLSVWPPIINPDHHLPGVPDIRDLDHRTQR